MGELTLLLLRIGFLVLMWFFVFAVVYSLRADLFGVRVRRMPEPAPAAAPAPIVASATAATAPVAAAKPSAPASSGGPATTDRVSRIVITSGPKAGLELPLGSEPLTIGRSSESGLVIRDDYTSSHHARLVLWGDQWMIQDLDSTNGTWHDGTRVSAPT
ncbi:MAG: FHA domain-containing protein, partial [Microbacterium sp.]|nr:FHA domain-containing protein [Microbacterium sp.]